MKSLPPLLFLVLALVFTARLAADIEPTMPLSNYPGEIRITKVDKIPGVTVLIWLGDKYKVVRDNKKIQIPAGVNCALVGIETHVLETIKLKHLAPLREEKFYYLGRQRCLYIPNACIESNFYVETSGYFDVPVTEAKWELELVGVQESQSPSIYGRANPLAEASFGKLIFHIKKATLRFEGAPDKVTEEDAPDESALTQSTGACNFKADTEKAARYVGFTNP